MKSIARFFAYAALAAGFIGFSSVPAQAAKGKDFPGTTCTCQGCAPGGGDTTGDCASVCTDKTVYSKGSEPHDYCKAQGLTATGGNLRAAMDLVGLKAVTLARASKVSPATINRLLSTSRRAKNPDAATVDKVTKGLQRSGIEITEDGVRLMQKPLP